MQSIEQRCSALCRSFSVLLHVVIYSTQDKPSIKCAATEQAARGRTSFHEVFYLQVYKICTRNPKNQIRHLTTPPYYATLLRS